jgi:hypothetical protein
MKDPSLVRNWVSLILLCWADIAVEKVGGEAEDIQ